MKKLKLNVTGMIEVPVKDALSIGLTHYSYTNYNDEEILSVMTDSKRALILFPRNLNKFTRVARDAGFEVTYVDKRFTKELKKTFQLYKKFELKDYQEKAVKEVLKTLRGSKENGVILKAPPGFGKSFILPFIVKELQERTLIIVDRTDLVDQMSTEFSNNVKAGDIQVITAKNKNIGDVNIATFQFLIRNPKLLEELAKEIGFVVVDECHTISVGAFTEIVNKLPAKYRLGLSATPSRSDGLTAALFDVMSNNIVEGENPKALQVQYLMLKLPDYMIIPAGTSPVTAWGDFYARPSVTESVVRLTRKMLKAGRAPMIYSTYVKAQNKLKLDLAKYGISSEIVNQKTPKADRKEIFRKFQDREIDVIISGTIVQKGLSLHRLDTVINAANHTKESLEQLIGRLRRDHPLKKTPMFIDLAFQGKALWKATDRAAILSEIAKRHGERLIMWSADKTKKFLQED